MGERAYLVISAAIFALVAVMHIVRLVNHWSFQVGAIAVPFWGSWLALLIGAALSIWAYRLITRWSASHQ